MAQRIKQVFSFYSGALVTQMLALGRQVGLLQALSEQACTAAQLAAKTGLSERFVIEWARCLAAANVLSFQGDGKEMLFLLPEDLASVLLDPGHPAFIGTFADVITRYVGNHERLKESFKSGIGYDYEVDASFSNWMEEMHEPFTRFTFFAVISGHAFLSSLFERDRIRIADIGCSSGQLLRALAHRNPRCSYIGFDINQASLSAGEAILQSAENREISHSIRFQCVGKRGELLPSDESFDAAITTDMLHDATQPSKVIESVFKLLNANGVYLMVEPKAVESAAQQIKDPTAAFKYGLSINACLASSLSEPNSPGFGMLGLHSKLIESMCFHAGFKSFEIIPSKADAFNNYYLAWKNTKPHKL